MEERLWEIQLKVATAFRHHTLRGWGGGLLVHPSCSQLGTEVHGFPFSNEGRQAEKSAAKAIPRTGYGCAVPASSGP